MDLDFKQMKQQSHIEHVNTCLSVLIKISDRILFVTIIPIDYVLVHYSVVIDMWFRKEYNSGTSQWIIIREVFAAEILVCKMSAQKLDDRWDDLHIVIEIILPSLKNHFVKDLEKFRIVFK